MKHKILFVSFFLGCILPINAEQLDFLFSNQLRQTSMSVLQKKCKLTDAAPLELVDYRRRNTIFSHRILEAIFRFGEDKKLRSADLSISATQDANKRDALRTISDDLCEKIKKALAQNGVSSKLTLPNKRVIEVMCWETPKSRIYLWHSDPVEKDSQDISFSHIRWELKSYPRRKYFAWYAADKPPYALLRRNKDKIVIVPHRKQSDDTGNCAPTIVSCQMAQCGSEIPPIIFFTFWDTVGEAKAMEQIGQLLGVKYSTKRFDQKKNIAENCIVAMKEYNTLADQRKQPKIKYKKEGKKYIWLDNFSNTDPQIWEKIKNANYKDYTSFREHIIQNIDKNIPVAWSIKRHNSRGRHRRMIIGYNLQKDIVFYYDTWGDSRKMRSMPFRAAYLMTIWSQRVVCQ